jgi:Ca2+/Na+ antiporter
MWKYYLRWCWDVWNLRWCILLWFVANTTVVIVLWMWFMTCMNLYIYLMYESGYELRIQTKILNHKWNLQSDLYWRPSVICGYHKLLGLEIACDMCLTQATRTRNRLWCVSITSGSFGPIRLWSVSITSGFRLTTWDIVLHHRCCTTGGSWNRLCRCYLDPLSRALL